MKYWRSKKDIIGIGKKGWHQQRQPGTNPVQLGKQDVKRDDCGLRRQHDRRDQENKQNVFSRQFEASEAIGYQDAGDQRADRANTREQQAVAE